MLGDLTMTLSKRLLIALLWPLLAGADSITNFSVSAIDGPFPAVLNAPMEITDQESVTIMVEPDGALERSINPFVDAIVGYSVSYAPVQVGCPQTASTCGGSEDYQVWGNGVNVGISGTYGGEWNTIDPTGEPSGILYLSAGEHTFYASASTS